MQGDFGKLEYENEKLGLTLAKSRLTVIILVGDGFLPCEEAVEADTLDTPLFRCSLSSSIGCSPSSCIKTVQYSK